MSEQALHGSLDSKEALDIDKAWEGYWGGWKTEKQLAELFEVLKPQHSNAISAGQFSAVHNSIYRFIHEVERLGPEGRGFLEAAEFLTKQLLLTGNSESASAINTLAFSLLLPAENYERAEYWLTQAVYLEAGDQSENSLNNLAIAFSMQGKDEMALALFLRSWAFTDPDYKPEAMYHLAHLLGSCAEHNFVREILYDVTQAPDTNYAIWAQNCLWGKCTSKYKPSLNSPRHTPGTKELLHVDEGDFLKNLFPRIGQVVQSLPESAHLDAVELDIESFESPKFALEHVQENGRATSPLVEFAQVHSIGNLKLHKVAMSLVLYQKDTASFSTLGCAFLAEWARGNLPNPTTLAGLILSEKNFLPVKQPLLNFAIQECLLSGIRAKADYVDKARQSTNWKSSYEKAVAGFPMLSVMEVQAEDGDLNILASGLSAYCRSDYPSRYKDVTSVIPLVANELLTFLMAEGDAYLNFDSSKAMVSVANTVGHGESSDNHLFLLSGASRFIDRRLSLILGTERDSKFAFLAADDIYFLAMSVFSIAGSDLRSLVRKCAALKSWGLLSKSLSPLVDKIATLAWSRGAVVDWSDGNLKSLDSFIRTVGKSQSLTDIALIWNNEELRPLLEGIDSPLAQVASRNGLMSLDMKPLEDLDLSSLLTLCKLRSLPEKFYKFAMDKVPIEGVAVLATNPDSFGVVQQQLAERLPLDTELAFVAANTFVTDQSLDWPRALPKVLASMNNARGLALLVTDHRLQDSDLQVIANKADKKIAKAINEHPNASDETKALAQLIA